MQNLPSQPGAGEYFLAFVRVILLVATNELVEQEEK